MKKAYRLTSRARDDLTAITNYISHRSPQNALLVHDEITRAMELLAEMPGIGHRREDLTSRPLLFWAVYSFLIVYRPDRQPIEIVHVIHGARDVKDVLEIE